MPIEDERNVATRKEGKRKRIPLSYALGLAAAHLIHSNLSQLGILPSSKKRGNLRRDFIDSLGGRAIIYNKEIRHIMCQNSLLFLARKGLLLEEQSYQQLSGLPGVQEPGTCFLILIDRHTRRKGLVFSSYVSICQGINRQNTEMTQCLPIGDRIEKTPDPFPFSYKKKEACAQVASVQIKYPLRPYFSRACLP